MTLDTRTSRAPERAEDEAALPWAALERRSRQIRTQVRARSRQCMYSLRS